DMLEVIEIYLAIARIVDVGTERERLVGRSQRAGNEARATILRLELIGDRAGEPGAFDIDLAHQMLGTVIGLADPVGREGVGLGDVRPRLAIGAVDRRRHLGHGQRENVVIAPPVMAEAEIAGIGGLVELPVLDLGAERPVGDQDALGGFGQQFLACGHHRSSILPGTGRGTRRSVVGGARRRPPRRGSARAPTPLRVALPLPAPERIRFMPPPAPPPSAARPASGRS
ncbi:hypothetical protein QU38_02785, partial [Staphylococcus aureus]